MAFPYATAFRHAMHGRERPPAFVTLTGGDILTDDETGYGYGRSPVTRAAIRRTLGDAALVQANSPLSADAAAAYGCAWERIAVQPPHSPHEPLALRDVRAYRARCRQELIASAAIPPGRLLVGIGRMVPIKGYDDVIRALPLIRAAHPNTSIMLAGPARDAAADLALIPSLLNGLNMTGVEAASVGTPSVVSERAGVAHYSAHVWRGRGRPAALAALAAAIVRLLGDARAWEDASRHALQMAAPFSLAQTADGVARLYDRLHAG